MPSTCSLCGLPPVGEELVAGIGELSGNRYCCPGCAAVDDVLHQLPEEERAAAMLEIAKRVGLPAEQVAALEAAAAVDSAEDDAVEAGQVSSSKSVIEERFRVSGMQCPSCSWLVEHTLNNSPGVLEAKVDFLTEIGTMRLDLRKTSRATALGKLESVGYRSQRLEEVDSGDPERLVLRCAVSAMAAMNTMMLAFVHYAETFGASSGAWRMTAGAFGAALAIPAVVYGGAPIFRRALALLRHRYLAMETLLALGIASSLGLSMLAFVLPEAGFYFEIPTMIVTTSLGARLVDRAIRRVATGKVATLLKPAPVRVRLAGEEPGRVAGFVDVSGLEAGQRIAVPAGEEVPADVEVEHKPVLVSEAVLTGEPHPILKRVGTTVLAGSEVVGGDSSSADTSGVLVGQVLRRPEASAHAQIGQQILDVVRGQSEATELADTIAAWFVIAVLVTSGLTVVGHLLFGGGGLLDAAVWLPAVAVLVVACPCAFSIAASASMGTAAIRLLGDGVLLRRPEAMEAAAKTDVVVFDKTGTLTYGDMDVREVEWFEADESGREQWLAEVAALESESHHPMAIAIRRYVAARGIEPASRLDSLEERGGYGIVARRGDKMIAVGIPALFETEIAAAGKDARSAVVFGPRAKPVGRFIFDDPIRDEAPGLVNSLQSLGVEVRLLSGDDESVVARCAEELGIEHYEGRALPRTKAERVEALRREGRQVMYVGDGINDAPALAAASVGVAMRHGASMALETSDLLAVRDDPSAALRAMELARRLRRITLQNYSWAIGYNVLLVPVAALGWLHPTYSALAMLFSSVTVLANSTRLLRR